MAVDALRFEPALPSEELLATTAEAHLEELLKRGKVTL